MKVVIDIEANGLENPTKIWLVVCKDIDTGDTHIFREIDCEAFKIFSQGITLWIGHNILGYDWPVLVSVWGCTHPAITNVVDTLICSKLADYSRDGHSVEQYGLEFGFPKIEFSDFSKYSPEMEVYCVRDVEITHKIYLKYLRYISNVDFHRGINREHKFQLLVNDLHNRGFAFNSVGATDLLVKVREELAKVDKDILDVFQPKEVLVREFTPRLTKHGTISRASVPRSLQENIHLYEAGKVYKQTKLVPFNPASTKQIVDVLHEAGWQPVNKTKTRIELERQVSRLKYKRDEQSKNDLSQALNGLDKLGYYGYKIDETNLSTLPSTAPTPARTLAKRIMLESRRRTLTEWLGLVKPDGRIHGEFWGIGAWTHRMAHTKPNTANIPNDKDIKGLTKLFGKEMRKLWIAPKNRLLVGVDAEGIQLRIFAHYINDQEFTDALVRGRKDDKTDPHSLNQRILGSVCRSRAAAKRFIFALLLGGGIGKLGEILDATSDETRSALDRMLERYTGFAYLKEKVIPDDAKRGYFFGLDGLPCKIPGEDLGTRKHLCMSGFLQNGEEVVMKEASNIFVPELSNYDAFLVDLVHDEWQIECPNDFKIAREVAELAANSLPQVSSILKLNCPLAGSYWNDDAKDFTIGTNWYQTH